jgi:hypothetical protein
MKHRLPVVLMLSVVLGAAGCKAPADQSIIVTLARAPGSQCDFSDNTKYVESAPIDVAAYGYQSSYFQVFGWENDLENISVTVTQQITTDTPNTFIATTIEDTYDLVNGTSPPPGLISISATIAPGGVPTTNTVGVYFLAQSTMADICGPPTATENCPLFPVGSAPETLLVTFQISGALVGGGATRTNAVTYPVTLFNSGNTIPSDATNPSVEPWICKTGAPQVTSCGIPGRDITYCP